MVRMYFRASSVLAVLAIVLVAWMETSPPEQHGRGMGAALLAAWVMLGALAVGANGLLALVLWLRSVAHDDATARGEEP